MSKYKFRDMRNATAAAKAEVGLLLGLSGITWPHNDYALFITMERMTLVDNPTYRQSTAQTGAWLRFLQRLIEQLPDGDLRAKVQPQFEQLSEPYKELLR